MDYRPSNMKNIVQILGEAENVVRGLKDLDTSECPNFFCPPLRIGRPILEPLDSSMEPTPLGPSAVIPNNLRCKERQGFFCASGFPKCTPVADTAFSQAQQVPVISQHQKPYIQVSLQQQETPSHQGEGTYDLSLISLDDTPLSLECIDDLEALPCLVSSSSYSGQDTDGSSTVSEQQMKRRRVRKYKEDQWNARFQDLLQFRAEEGHVMVPHSYPKNQKLAQWVKRQRYQFRLKQMGKHSTLSDAREDILSQVGFVWDSHKATWTDHFQTLEAFAMANGHCYIPPQMAREAASLITWCKHQRRQFKRYQAGLDSTMTPERIRCLESIGFDWNPRNLSIKQSMN
ncbi:helicase domain protein [Nitzschia inconspicua]|uniref:Helicase domain protein n=1 Tax=Nitzschia inconspicua TaxID=303405 RepID=A0A9K3LC96_9STRA|nr:helicase domain protein [Nitzschia inconspicua]